MNLLGKRTVIYGDGISGKAALNLAKRLGADVKIYDDLKEGLNDKSVLSDAELIILSPGVDMKKPEVCEAVLRGIPVVSELEFASSNCRAEEIAVTGTNGKTTTTKLIEHIFNKAGKNAVAVGNVGTAYSSVVSDLTENDIAVIEASSFQLETCRKFSPDTAVILNVLPDHLERHGSMDEYIKAKANISNHQGEQDFVVFNADDEIASKIANDSFAKKVPFSLTQDLNDLYTSCSQCHSEECNDEESCSDNNSQYYPSQATKWAAYVHDGKIYFAGQEIISLNDVDMKGDELQNALASVAVAMLHDISEFTVREAIKDFVRPDYRRKYVGSIAGVKFYNDSKATNVSACLSACRSMDGGTVLMLGGAKREEDFNALFDNLPRCIKWITVAGDNAKDILSAASKANFENVCLFDNLKDELSAAYGIAKSAKLNNVLFSPSSKSFDRYSSYGERGKDFDLTFTALEEIASDDERD